MTRSDYNEKQETKKERLLERAEQAEAKSSAAYAEAGRIGEAIPFGQPVLVGHHSERRHRADIERIDQNMRKSVEEGAKAKELRRRAEAVGTAGISSDDPDAVLKLETRVLELEAKQAARKLVNAAWRRAGKPSPENRDAWQ